MSINQIKILFFKKYFDFDSPSIALYDFHPHMRFLLIFNGIFFHKTESKLRFCWPFITLSLSLIGSSFQLIFIYHGVSIENYSFATECFCYFIILSTVPVVCISIMLNKTRIVQILDLMNQDFLYICSLGPKYRNKFLGGQLLIWQLCILWFIFTSSIIFMYFSSTMLLLLYQSLFATQHENMIRPLPFPFWLPKDDPYRTPNYEIFLSLEILVACFLPQTFCVFVYMFFHVLLHCFYMMDMIIFDCEALFRGLDESVVRLDRYDPRRVEVQLILNRRLKRIVKWHVLIYEYIKAVSSVFGPVLVYQVAFSSIIICMVAYQVAYVNTKSLVLYYLTNTTTNIFVIIPESVCISFYTSKALDHGKFNLIFTTLLCASCLQLWIPCFLGTLIRNKAFAVGDSIWNSGWNETSLSLLIRADILIIIMRTQQPINIKFTALPKIELETFSSIMGTSYSYFNILRQYK